LDRSLEQKIAYGCNGSFTLIRSPVLSGGSTIHSGPWPHDQLLYVLQQPLGRIASMPATGQDRSLAGGAKFPWRR